MKSMIYYFLKEDFDELNRKINELSEKLKKFSLEIGKDYQEDRGIFTFEEGERQKRLWSARLRELVQIKNNAKIVMPSVRTDIVGIGRRVIFKDEITGKIQMFNIGSYMVLTKKKNSISYDTPIARLLIGAQVGEVREDIVGGRKRSFRILKIE